MRHYRNLICFLFGVVLAAYGVTAFGETIAATARAVGTVTVAPTIQFQAWPDTQWHATQAASCNGLRTAVNWPKANCVDTTTGGDNGLGTCGYLWNNAYCQTLSINLRRLCPANYTINSSTLQCQNSQTVYECPANQSWTLSGTNCTRPDCQPGETRNASGQCTSICQNLASNSPEYGWITSPKGTDPTATTYCGPQNCQVQHSLDLSANEYYYTATEVTMRYARSYTGQTCNSGQPVATPKNTVEPPTPPKKPPCLASEGVLTSSKGTVACVPPGTPTGETPKVTVKKTTEAFADGSQKITTETATTVPSTQAKDVQVSVQITANSSGTTGQAGTPGTTGSGSATVTDSNSDGQGDGGGGDCDPKKDFCGGPGTGGLYEKKSKTVAGVVGEFKTGLMASGIGGAATGFFTVSVPGGSCPSWVVNVAYLNTSVDLSQYFCTATALNMMNLVGGVLMFVAAFVGFRWAML